MSRISGALFFLFIIFPLAFAFSTTTAISAIGENASAPSIAFHGNGPTHMVWASPVNSTASQRLMYSNDGLNRWADGVPLANLTAPEFSPRIFADATGGLSAVFSSSGGIYCIHSPDGGTSWGTPVMVSQDGHSPTHAQGAQGKLGIAWVSQGSIRFAELAGCSPQRTKAFSNGGTVAIPRIAASPKGGYGIAWLDNTSREIMFAYTEGTESHVVSNTVGNSGDPEIAYDSVGTAHIAWRDAGDKSGASTGEWDIWHAQYPHNGAGPSASKPIAMTAGFSSEHPIIAISPQDIPHVLWIDDAPGNRSLVYSKSLDGGESWLQWMEVRGSNNHPESPLLIIDGNSRLHFFWESAESQRALWHAGWNGTDWAGTGRIFQGQVAPIAYSAILDQMNRIRLAFSSNGTVYESFSPGFGRNITMQLRLGLPAGACAGEPFNASITDEAGTPVPNSAVSLSLYNESSFAWVEIASGTTGFGGSIQLVATSQGNHRISAERPGYIGASKYLDVSQCSGPTPTPSPTPDETPSPTPDETPSPTPTPTPVQSQTPAPGGSACPLGALLFFPLLLLLRK